MDRVATDAPDVDAIGGAQIGGCDGSGNVAVVVGVGIGGAILFRDFVRIYERDVLSTHASTTQERSKSVLKNHLNPEFGDLMLREITLEHLQAYFAVVHRTRLSAESVDKIRDVLSGVLRTAVDYGRLTGNLDGHIAF